MTLEISQDTCFIINVLGKENPVNFKKLKSLKANWGITQEVYYELLEGNPNRFGDAKYIKALKQLIKLNNFFVLPGLLDCLRKLLDLKYYDNSLLTRFLTERITPDLNCIKTKLEYGKIIIYFYYNSAGIKTIEIPRYLNIFDKNWNLLKDERAFLNEKKGNERIEDLLNDDKMVRLIHHEFYKIAPEVYNNYKDGYRKIRGNKNYKIIVSLFAEDVLKINYSLSKKSNFKKLRDAYIFSYPGVITVSCDKSIDKYKNSFTGCLKSESFLYWDIKKSFLYNFERLENLINLISNK